MKIFVSANIPLTKLNNPSLRDLFKKYTGRELPDKSTIRKLYLLPEYDKTIATIKDNISDSYIWVSADETTDIKGRCVVNIVVHKSNNNTGCSLAYTSPMQAAVIT